MYEPQKEHLNIIARDFEPSSAASSLQPVPTRRKRQAFRNEHPELPAATTFDLEDAVCRRGHAKIQVVISITVFLLMNPC